jgi:hypothetical protein
MFGIMCKATDLCFPAFVLLTTDNVSSATDLARVKLTSWIASAVKMILA